MFVALPHTKLSGTLYQITGRSPRSQTETFERSLYREQCSSVMYRRELSLQTLNFVL